MHLSDMSFDERVGFAIERSPYLSGRRLRVETQAGRVVLQGVVGSYYQKQMAQEAVRRIDGVFCIDNRLEVYGPSEASWGAVP